MEYVLETSALTKHYRGFTALDSLTMRVPKGAIYGFVGRNGAGKTTLIRLICGLQEPTGGSFTLYGVRNTDARICRSRRRMGAVVETPSVYTDMTAEENLRQQYLVLGMPSTEGIPELLRLVGLEDTGKKKVKHSIFRWVCASGWGSPWRWREIRIFWCWTSRSTALTPRASSKYGS